MAMTKFRPYDDEELILYLTKFVCGIPFVECQHIRQINLYGDKKPSEIFDDSTDVNYVFTQLKRISVRGKNVNRIAGGGTWKAQENKKLVLNNKRSVIGFTRTFLFEEKFSDKSIQWHMKEYYLSDIVLKALKERRQIRHQDYVLCRIRRNVKFCSTINNFQSGEKNVVANQNHNLGLYMPSSSQNHGKISVSWTPSISKSSEDQFQALQENKEKFPVSWTPSISKSSEVQFQALQQNKELGNFLNGKNNGSLVNLVEEEAEWLDPISQLPLISTEEEKVSYQESTIDIASYHKKLDAYAAAILQLNPPLVPYIPQELDDCPLFSEDFYIGHHALWS